MKYEKYEIAFSVPRIGKYRIACKGDKNKALILYGVENPLQTIIKIDKLSKTI